MRSARPVTRWLFKLTMRISNARRIEATARGC
jgi:hypothetical protein